MIRSHGVDWSTFMRLLVYRWCRRWDLPEQEIADVFQDVFQAVATHIGGFRRERAGDTFRGWLRTITQNKVRDHFRKLGREPGGAGGTEAQIRFARLPAARLPAEDDSGPAEGDAECRLFGQALDLIRGEFEGAAPGRRSGEPPSTARRPVPVALELGMSPGAVRVAKSRVLRRLREELGDALAGTAASFFAQFLRNRRAHPRGVTLFLCHPKRPPGRLFRIGEVAPWLRRAWWGSSGATRPRGRSLTCSATSTTSSCGIRGGPTRGIRSSPTG